MGRQRSNSRDDPILVLIGCDVNSALERVSEAQHLSADLLIQFTKAADAANRAVMADTDEASVEFALKPNEAKGRSKQTSMR